MMMALDNGFHEVVGLVADASASAARLGAALGYIVRHSGPVPEGALALMGLPQGQGGHEVVIGHPQAARGDIRLIALDGEGAGVMRDGAQAWDSGGIFDINVRALAGIEPVHHALGRAGFTARAPITDWDFGTLAVREVVETDGDGLCTALMERVRPPLTGYEGLPGPASWVFNSTQVVADFAAARAFYVDALGWRAVQETQGPVAADASGANCMGFPAGLAGQVTMQIGIYQPHGRMEGSVEIIAFSCATLDFSAKAVPPLRGWASLRFPVRDLDGFAARTRAGGCEVIGPVAMDWAPHGKVRGICAVTPWGARLEAVEPA